MSKYQYRQSDIYLPGTDIPRNRLNIREESVLHAIEAELLTQAYEQFAAELESATRFDEAYFKSLHRRTFETLYEWAGQYRQEDMVKAGSMFCRAAYLDKESARIFQALAAENNLRDAATQPLSHFAERLAHHQGEMIALHPFYELNGRITRMFFDLLVISHGYAPIDYSRALQDDPEVGNSYIRASIDCVQRADARRLQALIQAGLTRMDEADA